MTSFYTEQELKELGLKKYGANVLISRKCSIYGASQISIGDNVRIDDFCILSGNITIGNHVHIAAYSSLFAGDSGIDIGDFCGISSRSALYAESDDYTGEALTNPTVPEKYKLVTGKKIIMERHSLIGTGCTVLPGVIIGQGASIGAMSLINKNVESWSMNVGCPCRKVRNRNKKMLEYEKKLLNEEQIGLER